MARRRASAAAASDGLSYLVFAVGDEEYALPLLEVREIVGLAGLSAVADAPEALKGVLRVRGEPIAIVDLAVVLGVGGRAAAGTPEACALIGWQAPVGMLVDGVRRVIALAAHEISPAPRLGGLAGRELVTAVARPQQGLVPILDLERLLASEEIGGALDAMRSEAPAPEPQGVAR